MIAVLLATVPVGVARAQSPSPSANPATAARVLAPGAALDAAVQAATLVDAGRAGELWDALLEGGETMACGWLKDRYGLSWQVVPDRLIELTTDSDPAKAAAATKAMLGMRKIVIAELEDAVAAAGV